MKKLFLALSLVTWLSPICAQQNPIGLIFRISAAEAAYLYKKAPGSIPETYFHTLIDSFEVNKPERPLLTNGHYLEATAVGESIQFLLKSIHSYSILSLNNERDLMLRIMNQHGVSTSIARLKIGNKKIPYDESVQSYRLKRRSRGGFLRIELESDTLFYQINQRHTQPLIAKRYKRFTQTDVGFIITSPIRWTSNIYRYFERVINWGDWQMYRPLFPRKHKSFNGYVVTHKPKYQPGDTLQLKAFITTPKGKPITKPLKLNISHYSDSKAVLDTLVEPVSPGAFVVDWPLGDTLKLDRSYNISLAHPKRSKPGSLNHHFKYEDYQLDQVVYSFEASQDTFRQGEAFNLTASAKDQNELPVFDAHLQLHLLAESLISFHEDEMRISDTLWTYETAMNQKGEANIALPDSLFPPAKMNIKAVAAFTNSNGELQEKTTHFTYTPVPGFIDLKAEQGMIIANYYKNGKSTRTSGLLITQQYYREKKDSAQVALPLQIALDPTVNLYQLITPHDQKQLYLQDYYNKKMSGLKVNAYRKGDSLHFSLNNPNKLPVNWIIRHRSGTLTEGFTLDSIFQSQYAVRGTGAYYLYYQYLWGGKEYQEEKEIKLYKKLLQVSIEQDRQVMPGQEVQVKVLVKDYQNRPAEGVNLAIGAINAQFESSDHIQSPSVPYKRAIPPLPYNEFKQQTKNFSTKRPITKKWYDDLALDRSLYYRLRFPEEGVYFQSDTVQLDTFYQHIAQFAPFLVKNGKTEPIYLIYCNRKLVYYYDVDHPQPYSFVGAEGFNSINIRTRDQEITIDSVRLKKGHKLTFSLDLLHYPRWDKNHRIKRKPMPIHFTNVEKQLIKNTIFVLKEAPKNQPAFIWDEADNIYIINKSYPRNQIKTGPFLNQSRLYYKEPNGLKTEFIFEPGFSYDLTPERERLYEYAIFETKDKPLPSYPPNHSPNNYVYTPSVLKTQALVFRFRNSFSKNTEKIPPGRYVFSYNQQGDASLLAIVIELADTIKAIYKPNTRQLPGLPADNYTLTLIRSDQYVYQTEISIQPNTTLYQDLNGVLFRPDTNNLPGLITYKKKTVGQTPPFPGPNPYIGGLHRVRGRITDESGEPLIGASVLVKGTTQGTVTDMDGYYDLVIPEKGSSLVFSYTGFANQEIQLTGSPEINVNLYERHDLLEMVVVHAYSSSSRKNLKAIQPDAVTVRGSRSGAADYYVDGILQGRVAGVEVSGYSSIALIRGASTPDINAPLFIIDGKIGDPSKVHPSQIRSIKKLANEEAMAIYGSRAANGAIIITTTGGLSLDFFNPEMAKSLRSEFRDYAYWVPNLTTDKNGEARFKVTFPDNITAWNAYALGMDHRQRSGLGFSHTQAFKPLMAQLAVPRFLIEGDEVSITGKASNYTSDSLQIETRFYSSDSLVSQQKSWLREGKVESAKISAGMAGDSLAITYSLKALKNRYEDGEKRSIPTLPQGTIEHTGQFLVLDQDTSLSLSFSPDSGQVELYVEQDLLPVLLKEIQYLKNYQYGCNEQTASKLMALVLEKEIRQFLGETFEDEEILKKCLQKLEANQNDQGSWGWWNRTGGSPWISRHVIRALLMAEQAGYPSPILEPALRWLTNNIKILSPDQLLPQLQLLAEAGQTFPYGEYLSRLDSLPLSVHDRLQSIRIRQLNDLPYSLDSLYHYRKSTMLGSHYWGNEGYQLHQNAITTTLLAYTILLSANKAKEADLAQRYLLERRRNTSRRHAWRNTIETALILRGLLPQLLSKTKTKYQATQLVLKGAFKATLDTFPQKLTANALPPKLHLQKMGTSILYFTVYQRFLNKSPEAKDKGFRVKSHLEQGGRPVDTLEHGKKASLVVNVVNETLADYVMLEVPIPAACSYYAKPNGRRGHEVHREYARHQTSIFFEHLPAGTHEFIIELEPRFSGSYQLNPAKAELMYFPLKYGREGVKKVQVR